MAPAAAATRNGDPLYDIAGQAHHPSSGAGDAGAHLGAARARRHAERVRDRVLHRRAGRARRRRTRCSIASRSCPTRARAASSNASPAMAQLDRRARRRARAAAAASALRATRTAPPMSAVVVELEVDEDDPSARGLVRDRCRPGGQSGRRHQPARGRHHPVRKLGAQGAGAAREQRHQLARLGQLSGAAVQRGAGDPCRV